MKAVILAGGLGTRISEETHLKPKPMIEIGGYPILWHILKIYSYYGINDFIICSGYKGYVIKEYFSNYMMHNHDITIDLKNNSISYHNKKITDSWNITIVDTGEDSMTGGRLKRVKKYIQDDECFCFTYGDGLSNVNVKELIKHHKKHNKLATITAVQPPGRYGALSLSDNLVIDFKEKADEGGFINGGFFILSPKCIDLIHDDQTIWEYEPMQILSKKKQLTAYKHFGFWQPMDTLREKKILEELWSNNKAPWKLWKN